MTIDIDKAIDILSDNHTVLYSHGDYTEQEEGKAQSMAIKSLEAWEKVKEEIKQKSDYTKNIWDEYPDEWYAGKCSAYHESLEIIDKYLAEVSE